MHKVYSTGPLVSQSAPYLAVMVARGIDSVVCSIFLVEGYSKRFMRDLGRAAIPELGRKTNHHAGEKMRES